MRPAVPHFVYTLEAAIARGGHLYCAQTMRETVLGILQTFVADDFLTNTSHRAAMEMIQRVMVYYSSEMTGEYTEYIDKLKAHPAKEQDDGMFWDFP